MSRSKSPTTGTQQPSSSVGAIEVSKDQILLIDDRPSFTRGFQRKLSQLPEVTNRFKIEVCELARIRADIAQLESRRKCARRRGSLTGKQNRRTLFDDSAVLVVDFDLLELDPQSFFTGENIAYLARCYSECGLILALNQFGQRPFDLTLAGHPESYADLNLGDQQLTNSWLWGGTRTGFKPWSWLNVPKGVDAYRQRTNEVRENLDEQILGYLGFSKLDAELMPRSVVEFLQVGTKNPSKTTFRQFVTASGNGLKLRDKASSDDSVSRIAAARLSKWLERLVLPCQEILVDAPHLVSRLPSLLTGDIQNVASWNKSSTRLPPGRLGLRSKILAGYCFQFDDWISRPVWKWRALSEDGVGRSETDTWPVEHPDFVFCEDISEFLPRDSTREFVAEIPSASTRRYVADDTSSAVREFAEELGDIEYRPTVRFSL